MQETLGAWAPALPPPDVIRRKAEEIISRPDYDVEGAVWDFSLLEWLLNTPVVKWLLDLLKKILSPVGSALNTLFEISPWLGWLTIVALLAITALLIAHIIYSIAKAMRGGKELERILDSAYEAERAPETWEKRARGALDRQDYMAAVRCLFRACLLRLELAGKQRIRRGATNREYLSRFRDTPAFDPLRRFVEVIDLKWYGGGSCLLEDYQDCAQAHSDICRFAQKVLSAHPS